LTKSTKQLIIPKTPLWRRMLYNFHSILNLSRIDNIWAKLMDIDGAIILMYHSVTSDENKKWIYPGNHITRDRFENHMRFLANERNVISLGSLITCLKENRPLPRGTTVITLDDGYLDNLTNAAPILKKYNLPATIYLATGYIEREENQWIDQLFSLFNERSKDKLIIPELFRNQIVLDNYHSIRDAYTQISKYLIKVTYEQRIRLLAAIKKQLDPGHHPPKLTMSWNDVRTIEDKYQNITIGSHTYNHIDISRLSRKRVKAEIKICTDDIERETGRRPVHFSCPYSRSSEYLPMILKSMEYISSVSDSSDILINSKSYPYLLGRVEAPANILRLAHYTSGTYPKISKLLTKGRY